MIVLSEQRGYCIPSVVETERPHRAVTSKGEVLSHGGQQLSPKTETITTCAGQFVKLPQRLKTMFGTKKNCSVLWDCDSTSILPEY